MRPKQIGGWFTPSMEMMYAFQCPCGGDECFVVVTYKEVQLGYEVSRIEQHEFWTHDYEGEIDIATGTILFT